MTSERILPPIRLPFTVRATARAATGGEEPSSWGKRLGVWWDDAPEGFGVVITGTVRSGAQAATLLRVGDRIVAADGQPIGNLGDLTIHLERFRSSQIQLTVRTQGGAERSVLLSLGPAASDGSPAGSPERSGATVPLCAPLESLHRHIETILSTPRQQEVLPEGVAAEPEFGCLGAGLDFAQVTVAHSLLRTAILANEKRLQDVEIESVEQPDPVVPKAMRKVGVVVKGRFIPTGESVRLEYRFEQLSAARSRLVGGERAGVDETKEGGGDEAGS